MKISLRPFVIGILVTAASFSSGKPKDHLRQCWDKLVAPLDSRLLTFSYTERLNELEHSFEPWQQTNYTGKGKIWINADNFLKSDTLTNPARNRSYYSKTQSNHNDLLFLDYGDDNLFAVTQSMVIDQPFRNARYSPVRLIDYFYTQKATVTKESNTEFAVYQLTLNKTIVTIFIRKNDNLLHKVTTLHDDELFGDVNTTFIYSGYKQIENLYYPTSVSIEKINGKVIDEVQVTAANVIVEIPILLSKPVDYVIKVDEVKQPQIKTEKFRDNIHLIELSHTDDKVMVVEFADFLLVAEAPLNSKNGELIIEEAKKIAPGKPIRYFVFGHYHPHYLGGIRPFIHQGAKIICMKEDQEYVRYIASANHTLNPDALHREQKPVVFEEVRDSLAITDGNFTMMAYFIGNKSQHTNDYLIYYFPSEKILFEDDLVWIAREGELRKASARQAGLYNAIKSLGLEVETIIQSWPVADYGVKTIIPFADLEKSMR